MSDDAKNTEADRRALGIAIIVGIIVLISVINSISEKINLHQGLVVLLGIAGIAILFLAFRWWFWAFIFFVAGLASLFSVIACIIHFQILWAVIYFFTMVISWVVMAAIGFRYS